MEVVKTTTKLPKLLVTFAREILMLKRITGSRESPNVTIARSLPKNKKIAGLNQMSKSTTPKRRVMMKAHLTYVKRPLNKRMMYAMLIVGVATT